MTLSLPPHQENHFKEILDEIPTSQKCIGIDKWNWILGELCSMDTALTGAWGLFRHMQESLRHVEGERLALTRGVHQAISELHLLTEDQSKCPFNGR